jgi:7-carboxy-7-deazaguanine synthase
VVKKAPVVEIFPSIQGEGIYATQKQIFIRFGGCNLSCSYCDEPASRQTPENFKFLSVAKILKAVSLIKKEFSIHTVSLTGGEPLLHADFLKPLCEKLKQKNSRIYLETNATLPKKLKKIVKLVDVISADIKLPSSTGVGLWDEHYEFLKQAPEKTFVKMVIENSSFFAEGKKAINLIRKISKDIPLVIQPATVKKGKKPSKTLINKIYKCAKTKLTNVRVQPQLHALLGIK